MNAPRLPASPNELREKILREAIGIVFREGPARFTMRALARHLGYSPATIYVHFHAKDELLKEIALHGFDLLAAAVEPSLDVADPFEAVATALRAYVDFGLEHHALYRLMFEDIRLPIDGLPTEESDRVLRVWHVSRQLYGRGIASGAFRPSTPELEASVGWSMLHGFVRLAADGRLPAAPTRLLGGDDAPLALLRELRDEVIEARLRALRP
jgi:AcrR family transcriptional regulator